MNLQKVYEHESYGYGYGHTKVGLRVDDRIIWFGFTDSSETEKRFREMERLVDRIVERCEKR